MQTIILSVLLILLSHSAYSFNGIALHGSPKYSPETKYYDFANPNAPKGGSITLGHEGQFDTLNPYAIKGIPPLVIGSIANLVVQSLAENSKDEPFTMYPVLAESLEIAKDKLSMKIKLRKNAKFHDGKPVTTKDVKFSFDLFMSTKVRPFYNSYYADIEKMIVINANEFEFHFKKVNPELPLIATQIDILPEHVYGKGDFEKDFANIIVGSGPYKVAKFERNKYVIYERDKNFWGNDLGIFKGRYNFDSIKTKYYKDETARIEAFKKGDFDYFPVYSSKVWGAELDGKKVENKWILKNNWKHANNAGGQIFQFNLRKKIFQDVKVRQAIALVFDFEWANRTLFYNQYSENWSYFQNSPMMAVGKITAEQNAILEPIKKYLPEEVFSQEVGYLGKGLPFKRRLRLARKLLKDAGYKAENGMLVGPHGPLKFSFLLRGNGFLRIVEPFIANMRKIGIDANVEVREPSVWSKRVDSREFDIITRAIGQSMSPGNEQIDFWHSSEADKEYSRNYGGIKNKAIDQLIDKIIYAKTREDLELYTSCLDRVLYHLHIGVHNWHSPEHRISMWNRFGWPDKLPKYYSGYSILPFLWVDQAKDKALQDAIKKQMSL